jgi:hypothetical protein
MNQLVIRILRKLNLKSWEALFLLRYDPLSTLNINGYFDSFATKGPISKNGDPIPWFTYSCVNFLSYRLDKHLSVFEYGSGNSTLYFSKYVKSVTAVEHDSSWLKYIEGKLPENAQVIFSRRSDAERYIKSCINAPSLHSIIVIDGLFRNECAQVALQALSDDGVIIYDDMDRPEYKDSREFLKREGFRNIDFWGIAPGSVAKNCTSIFYRENNCLGI